MKKVSGKLFWFIISIISFSNMTFASLIEMDEVSIGYKDYFGTNYDPMITGNNNPGASLESRFDMNINTSLFEYLYWNNTVHGATDESQFRSVGWEWRLGLRATDWMDIGYYHHSQHLLDSTYKHDHFPLENALEVKIYLYTKHKRDTLF